MENNIVLDKLKETTEKYEKLEERVREIEADKSLNKYQFSQIMNTLEELRADINELKEKPSKRWELIISGIISVTITFLINFILKK